MTMLKLGRRIYLARHGETNENNNGFYSGRNNRPHLNRNGIREAVDLNPVIAQLNPPATHAASSALERAEITGYLATDGLPVTQVISSPDFDERDYEEGGKIKEDAESHEAHRKRVIDGINKLLENPDCTPLIFCHGGTIRRVMDAIGNFENAPDYIKIPNAAVIEVVTPSERGAADWQINAIRLHENGIERKPLMTGNLERYKWQPGGQRNYHA